MVGADGSVEGCEKMVLRWSIGSYSAALGSAKHQGECETRTDTSPTGLWLHSCRSSCEAWTVTHGEGDCTMNTSRT